MRPKGAKTLELDQAVNDSFKPWRSCHVQAMPQARGVRLLANDELFFRAAKLAQTGLGPQGLATVFQFNPVTQADAPSAPGKAGTATATGTMLRQTAVGVRGNAGIKAPVTIQNV
jgi:hypothetical protein